jgi:hypothetical protein
MRLSIAVSSAAVGDLSCRYTPEASSMRVSNGGCHYKALASPAAAQAPLELACGMPAWCIRLWWHKGLTHQDGTPHPRHKSTYTRNHSSKVTDQDSTVIEH